MGDVVDKLKDMSLRRKAAHEKLLAEGSVVYEGFLAMARVTFADGDLDKRAKELIAIGISVVINCESCMQWHIEQAAAAGASRKQVLEAVEVGIQMGGGPASAYARFALEVMDDVFSEAGSDGD